MPQEVSAEMRIYLDACVIQRTFDDRRHARIVAEMEAFLLVFAQIELSKLELVSSEVLEYEISRIPGQIRRDYAQTVLSYANSFVALEASIEKRADRFVTMGVKPLDALHLASAEAAGSHYFCTCDARLLRRAKLIGDLDITVMSPLELVTELGL
jgi:predicted nucleic acid-binding protein